MSKFIDLTGLSRAIAKIKEWVLGQRTHYGQVEVITVDNYNERGKDLLFLNGKEEYVTITTDLIANSGQIIKQEIKLGDGESLSIPVGDNTLLFSWYASAEHTCIYMEYFFTEDHGSAITSISGTITVSAIEKQLPEAFIPDTIARKSDIEAAITNTLNTEV